MMKMRLLILSLLLTLAFSAPENIDDGESDFIADSSPEGKENAILYIMHALV